MIAQQDTPDDVNLTYYQLNEDNSKKFITYLKLFKRKVMSKYAHDFCTIYILETLYIPFPVLYHVQRKQSVSLSSQLLLNV